MLAGLACILLASELQAAAPRKVAPPGPNAFSVPRIGGGARWFPVLDDATPRLSQLGADGGVRLVERGLRLVEYPDGRIDRAADLLPEGGIGVLELPGRLGGGIVFHATREGSTSLWRAPSWTSKLAPMARLPFDASTLVAGFDRLYATSARTRAIVGVDASTGEMIGLGPIPLAPAYGGIAFSDAWLGAVEVDVRGGLVTFDAGASFHPVGVPLGSPGVYQQGGRAVVATHRGAFAIRSTGELSRVDGPSADGEGSELSPADAEEATDDQGAQPDESDGSSRSRLLGVRPLEAVALRGLPDSESTAVVVANGTLARVDTRDGRVASSVRHATSPSATCQAIVLGNGIGFACGENGRRTVVYAYEPPGKLIPVSSLSGGRIVMPGGTGAVAMSGACRDAPAPAGTYCILSRSFRRREIRVPANAKSVRVVALGDGRVAFITPPRLGTAGAIGLVAGDGKTETHALRLDALSSESRDLLTEGLWLDGAVEIESGTLAVWVAGSASFVGVRVGVDGRVTAGTVHRGIDRTSLSGPFALNLDEHGGGFESTDGGATWSEIAVPRGVSDSAPASGHEHGCTPVGCSVGSWVRIGWGQGEAARDLVTASEPPRAKIERAPIVMWTLQCAPTGESEGPLQAAEGALRKGEATLPRKAPSPARRVSPGELDSSAFRPFLGVPSPARAPFDLGFDFGTEDRAVQLRGYAWGARGAAWDREATWLVRVADRFAVRHAIWSSAPSRPPWGDAAAAAEAFGSEPSHRVSNEWRVLLDPMEPGGILWMRTGAESSLALVEQGRAIVVARKTDDLAIDRVGSAVKVAGRWYMGAVPGRREFDLLRMDAGVLKRVAAFPRYADDGADEARVVRNARGDAIGIWVVGHGQQGMEGEGNTWFVYPVDPETGAAGAPLVLPRAALARTPRPCGPDEEGWVLVREISPSFTRVELENVSESPGIAHVEVRLVANEDGLCLDAVAAQVEGDPPRDLRPSGSPPRLRGGAPLALTDRANDRRWAFRCHP